MVAEPAARAVDPPNPSNGNTASTVNSDTVVEKMRNACFGARAPRTHGFMITLPRANRGRFSSGVGEDPRFGSLIAVPALMVRSYETSILPRFKIRSDQL